MLKQKHSRDLHCVDSAMTEDQLQHILIPACALGVDVYRAFRAANPNWRPESYIHGGQNEKLKDCPTCCEYSPNINKQVIVKTHLTTEDLGVAKVARGVTKVARPISVSFANAMNNSKLAATENTVSFQATEGGSVMIKPQGPGMEEPTVMKISFKPVVRTFAVNDLEPQTKASAREDYVGGSKTQHIGVANLSRMKALVHPTRTDRVSEHSTSSEERSESTSMETGSFPEHGVGLIQGDMSKISRFTNSTLRGNASMQVDDQGLFDFVVATRKIPNGNSFSTLDVPMQRKLHDYFKTSCPPCPHCNSNTYVKFRYFNNSGKSNLLQPRYTCRNPDTCVTIQEKSGKAGSRDFTLPRAKEVESFPGGQGFAHVNSMQGGVVMQSPVLPLPGNKRPAPELGTGTPCEASERSAKLPNTTLTLQSMNGSGQTTNASKIQMVEVLKDRSALMAKTAEDSNSCSSTHTASDQQPAVNVRFEAEPSSEKGRLIVQPIGVQMVNNVETGTGDRTSKGKIAEVNICMYIDLSSATTSC